MKEKPNNSQMKQAHRAANGQLLPGARLNPNGRPRGSGGGFRAVMQMLVDITNRNQDLIREALRKEAEEHPFRFARQFILPGIPYKDRKAFRERIRAAEQAAFDKAQSPFSGVSKTDAP